MNSALIICGPTATGKTSLGLTLSSFLPAEILSADSRQVYKGMDIGTGKDIPSHAKASISSLYYQDSKILYYPIKTTNIWGYDLSPPDAEVSIASYATIADTIISHLAEKDHIPIIIGGSGLYIQSLIHPPETLAIKKDPTLRHQLESLSVLELQQTLEIASPQKFKQLNHSDVNNPRRLIRAIEVAQSPLVKASTSQLHQPLIIGLHANLDFIDQNISQRVQSRIKQGFDSEIKQLISKYSDWNYPAFSATGYREWRSYLEGEISQKEAIQIWIKREQQYARRQMTWFKKQENINWFDITKSNYQENIVDLVKNWYSVSNDFKKNYN